MNNKKLFCGFVAIVGRPNVGKSTLLNRLIGKKVSIVSSKKQTTCNHIIGIDTNEKHQTIYVDTPGFHSQETKNINHLMNQATTRLMNDVELVIFVVEGMRWTIEDKTLVTKLRQLLCPVLLVINKIDNIVNKASLLPHINFLSKQMNFFDIIPISAKNGNGINIISKVARQHIPESEHCFPKDYITNTSKRFMASEIIREKLIRFLGDELPYSVKIEIEQFILNIENHYNIYGLIFVKRYGQKKIIIGNKGLKIKKISTAARIDIEKFFSIKVHLKLWVKVKNKSDKNDPLFHF